MSDKISVSVVVLTLNEEWNIAQCLESVVWADEIFIVDSGSTDRTLGIAKQYTDKIYYHAFENFAQQKNWSQENLPIRNEWVFHLDADEKVSEVQIAELKSVFSSPINCDGFIMPRQTIFKGKWIRFGGHYPVYHLRLFKRDKGRCENRLYDQHFLVNGKIARLKGDIINIINPNLKSWRGRHSRWARLEAEEMTAKKKREINTKLSGDPIEKRNWFRYKVYYKMPIFIRPFAYFFFRYIISLGFLDGKEGLIFHFWQGLWYRFLVDIEIFKLKKFRKVKIERKILRCTF